MPIFRPRNSFYLRISKNIVLPVYLYLDDRHLEWMSDRVLQHVLEDLRPKILPKLQVEADAHLGPGGPASAKKGTVDTHRGEFYQFCYFLRKTQPHSVVMKTRTYAAAPLMPPPTSAHFKGNQSIKRRTKAAPREQRAQKKRKTKGKGRAVDGSGSDESASSSDDEDGRIVQASSSNIRRSTRSAKSADGQTEVDVALQQEGEGEGFDHDGDAQMEGEDVLEDDDAYVPTSQSRGKKRVKTIHFSLDIEEEEEKPKPVLRLKYQGFSIFGNCLCIVVEPWPPLSAPQVPSILRSETPRAPSIAPLDFVTAAQTSSRARSQTQLFFPDPDERERSETPFVFTETIARPFLPSTDAEHPGYADNDDRGGMMAFSQVLNAAGDVRAGAVDDDEDMEGAVFFGDADEFREL